MLRGRHRGLPVVLDRSIMLPHELQRRTTKGYTPRVTDDGRGTVMMHGPQPPKDQYVFSSTAIVSESS